jgi:hypothetical protein
VPPGVRVPGLRAGITNLAGLAAFIRARLGEVGDTLAPLLVRRGDMARPALSAGASSPELLDQARDSVVTAAAPFAPTSFARARLLRQMHACGLLSAAETEQVETLLGVAR